MVGGFPSKSEGNIFVVRWYALVVERSAVLVHIIADVLAAVAWTWLPLSLKPNRHAEKLAGPFGFFAPHGNVERVEVAINFNLALALEVGMAFLFLVAVREQIGLTRFLLIGHVDVLL